MAPTDTFLQQLLALLLTEVRDPGLVLAGAIAVAISYVLALVLLGQAIYYGARRIHRHVTRWWRRVQRRREYVRRWARDQDELEALRQRAK